MAQEENWFENIWGNILGRHSIKFNTGQIPKGVVPITWKDGSTTYSFQGKEYSNVKDIPVPRAEWINTTASVLGESISKIPNIDKIGSALAPIGSFADQLEHPYESQWAEMVGDSFQHYGIDRRIGVGIGYATFPGLGEVKAGRMAIKGSMEFAPALARVDGFTPNVKPLQIRGNASSYIDKAEIARRGTLKGPAFKMNRKELKAEIIRLQDEGMDFADIKKQLLGDEPMWIDNLTGEPISLQRNTKDPKKTRFIGWRRRLKRGPKRTLLTEQQSLGPGETAFTKYNAQTNKVELLVRKGDEIHHWNSIIDKSSAYVGLSTQEAKELTGLVREAGWMFGDNKANLIKMIRSDHKKIHAFMRENGIEGVAARKMMEKLYAGKSVKERFKILRGFMEHVQGAVDEELVRMGYQIPPSHAAAQAANREVLKTIKMP